MLNLHQKTQPVGICIVVVILFLPMLGFAKEAAPMAADPVMEKRVNEIAGELRCLVCQNQTIADSNAGLAIDLKNQVREMVAKGQTQDEIVDYMVKRYGDFVRYRPPLKPTTYLLWSGPLILMVLGLFILIYNLKKRKIAVADAPLSDDEHARLDSIIQSGSGAAQEGEGKHS